MPKYKYKRLAPSYHTISKKTKSYVTKAIDRAKETNEFRTIISTLGTGYDLGSTAFTNLSLIEADDTYNSRQGVKVKIHSLSLKLHFPQKAMTTAGILSATVRVLVIQCYTSGGDYTSLSTLGYATASTAYNDIRQGIAEARPYKVLYDKRFVIHEDTSGLVPIAKNINIFIPYKKFSRKILEFPTSTNPVKGAVQLVVFSDKTVASGDAPTYIGSSVLRFKEI